MKRRTRKSDQNGRQHKAAFDHAYQMLKPLTKKRGHNERPHHNRQGERIRFSLDAEHSEGGTFNVVFSRTTGFRLDSSLGRSWDSAIIKPESHRGIHQRLKAYRTKLIHWQNLTEGGTLTFRHFNLLLAALSYEAESNP